MTTHNRTIHVPGGVQTTYRVTAIYADGRVRTSTGDVWHTKPGTNGHTFEVDREAERAWERTHSGV